MRMRRCDCNRIFRRAISPSVSLIIMVIAITSALSPNLRLPSVICRTKPKPIWPSAPFSGARASGRNPLRIWKKPPHSIRKTQTSLNNLVFSYMALRNFEAADKTLDRVIAVAPQSFQARALKGFVAVLWKGDLSVAEKQFSSIPPETDPDGLMTWAGFGF